MVEQNIFDINGNTRVSPGRGWNSLAGIYRKAGACKELGRFVGGTVFSIVADPYISGVIRDFSSGVEPPFSDQQYDDFSDGVFEAESAAIGKNHQGAEV